MKVQAMVVGIAILSTTLVAAAPPSGKLPSERPADKMLELALKSPQAFVFVEQSVSNADSRFDVVITSALGPQATPETVYVRPGTLRIFRADAGRDGFTRQGGWYWRCGTAEGKSQFKQPGALIMVVRQQDGTVQWYALQWDLRC